MPLHTSFYAADCAIQCLSYMLYTIFLQRWTLTLYQSTQLLEKNSTKKLVYDSKFAATDEGAGSLEDHFKHKANNFCQLTASTFTGAISKAQKKRNQTSKVAVAEKPTQTLHVFSGGAVVKAWPTGSSCAVLPCVRDSKPDPLEANARATLWAIMRCRTVFLKLKRNLMTKVALIAL